MGRLEKQVQQNGIRSSSGRRVQEHFRGDKEKQAPQIRRVLYQGRKVHHVEAVGDRNASYDDFLNDLTKGGDTECRYGLYDFEYEHQCQGTTETSHKQKLFLMSWCPDSAKIKKKMLYSSSFDALKKS